MLGVILSGEVNVRPRKDKQGNETGEMADWSNVMVAFNNQLSPDEKKARNGLEVSRVQLSAKMVEQILPSLPAVGDLQVSIQTRYNEPRPVLSIVGDLKTIKLF